MHKRVAVCVAVMLAAFASRAQAGEYVVHACEGASVAGSGWTPSFSGWNNGEGPLFPNPLHDACGEAQTPALVVSFATVRATGPLSAVWRFDAPADTTITSLVLRRLGRSEGGAVPYMYAVRDASGAALELRSSAPWVIGVPDFAEQAFSGLSTRAVSFGLSCAAATVCDTTGQSPIIGVDRALVTLRDDMPPTTSASSVEADSSGSVKVPFSDRGGGVQSVALLIGGKEIRSKELCHPPFRTAVPCPTEGTVRFDGLSRDASDIYVQLADASGNRLTVASLTPAPDAQAPPAVPVPAAPADVVPIKGTVGLIGARTVRSRYSKPPVLKGTVKATDGSPLASAVVTTSDGNSAKTDSKGRFSVKLAKGPSREVRVSYGDSVQTVKVIVAAPIRFKANRKSTRNGRSITFTGTVPGAGKARTRVELQALAHGKWIPFKTADLRNGTFKANYRFTRTFFTQRYTFRAVIHEDDGFPYAAGKSAVVRVVVRA